MPESPTTPGADLPDGVLADLARYAGAIEAIVPPTSDPRVVPLVSSSRRPRSPDRRRFLLVGAAAAGLVVLLVTTLVIRGDDTTTISGPTSPPPTRGSWERLPASPLQGRNDAAAFTVGTTVFVMGGDDGPTDEQCTSPAGCSGVAPVARADGAAYDTVTRTWRRIADAPQGLDRPAGTVVGASIYVRDAAGDQGWPVLFRYDTAGDVWSEVDLGWEYPPDALGGFRLRSVHAVGDRLVDVSDGGSGLWLVSLRVFDPRIGEWTTIGQPPHRLSFDHQAFATTDHELIVVGGQDGAADTDPQPIQIYDFDTTTWRTVPGPSAPTGWHVHGRSLISLGTYLGGPAEQTGTPGSDPGTTVLFNGGEPGRIDPVGIRIDLDTGVATPMPEHGFDGVNARFGAESAGDDWIEAQGWAYHAPTQRWISLADADGAETYRAFGSDYASTWIGDRLFVWGWTPVPDGDDGSGASHNESAIWTPPGAAGGTTAEPAPPSSTTTTTVAPSGGWERVDDGPLSPRSDALALALGDEVFVIGGGDGRPCPPGGDCATDSMSSPLADGAAFDTVTRTWRSIATAPFPLQTQRGVAGRTKLFFWSVAVDQGRSQLLAYDVATDAWSEVVLPPPSEGGEPVRLLAHGDDLLAVVGGMTQTSHSAWRLPAGGTTWEDLARPARDLTNSTAAIAGDQLVLLGGDPAADYSANGPRLLAGQVLDLGTGTWTDLPASEIFALDSEGYSGPTWWPTTAPDGTTVLVNPTTRSSDGGQMNGYGRSYPGGGVLHLDGRSEPWDALPQPPAALGALASGGRAVGGGWILAAAAALHLPTGRWSSFQRTEGGKRVGAAVELTRTGQALTFGGARWGDPDGEGIHTADAWLWTPPAT